MKFKKFVKSIGADGVLYTRKNGERWLSYGSILMKVPEDIHTVACRGSENIPISVDDIIEYHNYGQSCELVDAVMTAPNGAIRDCVRIFKSKLGSEVEGKDEVAIVNDGFSLLDRHDIVELYSDGKTSALVVKNIVDPVDQDEELVGVILHTKY